MIDEARMLAEAGLEVGIYVKEIAGPSPVIAVVEEVGGGRLVVRQPGKKATQSLSPAPESPSAGSTWIRIRPQTTMSLAA